MGIVFEDRPAPVFIIIIKPALLHNMAKSVAGGFTI